MEELIERIPSKNFIGRKAKGNNLEECCPRVRCYAKGYKHTERS